MGPVEAQLLFWHQWKVFHQTKFSFEIQQTHIRSCTLASETDYLLNSLRLHVTPFFFFFTAKHQKRRESEQ